jgi:hypothetical protein
VEALLPLVDERFEMATPAQFAAEPDTYRGHDGLRRWFDSFYEVMDEIRFEPGEARPLGEQVAIQVRLVARGRTTGLELGQDIVLLSTIAGGLLTRIEFFGSFEEAEAEAG